MPPNDRMAQMMQMFATMASIRNQREDNRLRREQLQQQARQFESAARARGEEFSEGQVERLLDTILKSSDKEREALVELGQSMGLDQRQLAALQRVAATAPMSAQQFGNQQAQQGYAEAPAPQQAAMRQGAAFGALAGQPPGAAMISSNIANNPQAVQTIAEQQAGALTPWQKISVAMNTRQMELAEKTFDQNTLKMAQDYGLAMLFKKQEGGMTPAAMNETRNGMIRLLQDIGRGGAKELQEVRVDLYNSIARTIREEEIPKSDEVLKRGFKAGVERLLMHPFGGGASTDPISRIMIRWGAMQPPAPQPGMQMPLLPPVLPAQPRPPFAQP
jgi:hypothetical protein